MQQFLCRPGTRWKRAIQRLDAQKWPGGVGAGTNRGRVAFISGKGPSNPAPGRERIASPPRPFQPLSRRPARPLIQRRPRVGEKRRFRLEPPRGSVMCSVVLRLLLLLFFSGSLLCSQARAGPWRADHDNSRGWAFMTPAERVDHQRRLRSFSNYDECRAYQQEHHAEMERRARSQGRVLQPGTHAPCDQLRERGDLQ